MSKGTKVKSNPRGLEFGPLRITQYNIFSVNVAERLDNQFRRTATAIVVNMNSQGIWDGNTMHQIELKHCYNKASKGPTTTHYEMLPGYVLDILEIQTPNFGDLDIVAWRLYPLD